MRRRPTSATTPSRSDSAMVQTACGGDAPAHERQRATHPARPGSLHVALLITWLEYIGVGLAVGSLSGLLGWAEHHCGADDGGYLEAGPKVAIGTSLATMIPLRSPEASGTTTSGTSTRPGGLRRWALWWVVRSSAPHWPTGSQRAAEADLRHPDGDLRPAVVWADRVGNGLFKIGGGRVGRPRPSFARSADLTPAPIRAAALAGRPARSGGRVRGTGRDSRASAVQAAMTALQDAAPAA